MIELNSSPKNTLILEDLFGRAAAKDSGVNDANKKLERRKLQKYN